MQKFPLGSQLYSLVGPRGQAIIDRLSYHIGLLPKVNRTVPKLARPYPTPYKACLIISADFELAWGWRYTKGVPNPVRYALWRAQQARKNLPELLALFDQYEIPISWAVVGHLFLAGCTRNNGWAHPEVRRVPYFENEFWRYQKGDWFDADPCSDYRCDPAWYAPDIISAILRAKVNHEIACHSFSHVDFSDRVCPPEVADAELKQCQTIAQQWGVELKSFVFPGNLSGNLPSLKRNGFIAYRVRSPYELDYLRRDEVGLWQIPGGMCIEKPSQYWPDRNWIGALKRHIDLSIQRGTVCHFWFHPSMNLDDIRNIFPAVLSYLTSQRERIWVTTMGEVAEWLNKTFT